MSVHHPHPHDAADLHVTGRARYVDDIPLPSDALHLAFGLSPIARGQITALDLAPVRAAPDVVAVWDGSDLIRLFGAIPDCSPSIGDEPLLSDGNVHYAGQPIFVVAAKSHLAARRAARLARIETEEQTPILSVDEALAAQSWFDGGARVYAKGDIEAAFAQAADIIEGRVEIGGQEHFYLEGQAALALPQDNGDMVICASSQHPTEIQHKVAHALHLPMHAVRVEVRRMGGGFGGKESQGNHLAIACALVARVTGRAVKMRYDRDDDFMITGKRHDIRVDYRVALGKDGAILGVDFTHALRCGWSQDLSLPVADRAMLHADNAYLIPAMRITSWRLRTNIQSATAFRGFGGPQGMAGIERVMDHIAHRLGVDPFALRQRHFYAPAALAGPDNTTPYGQVVTDGILQDLTDALAQSADYAARREAIATWNAAQPILKRGIALTPVKFGISFTLTHLNQAGALVHVYQDGSVMINHGGTEMGQGLFQKLAQVAAHRFGLPLDHIRITATDTGKVPNTSATAASSGSDLNGMAVQAACDTIRARIAQVAAAHLQADADAIVFEAGMLRAGGAEMPFADAVALAYAARVSLSSTGFYATPEIAWDRIKGQGRPFYYFAYGAAISEVVIDTLTGENRILRADILHDCGASLNPALDIGQIEGGYVQGAGWLTTEELVWDTKGRLRSHAPATYKIPLASDVPAQFHVALWQGENPAQTLYRSKAVGEPPFMLGLSVWSALHDACAQAGPHFPDLGAPATPEAVLAAVRRARGAS